MIELNKIYNEDCIKGMQQIEDNFIDITITSPPYDNLRTYNNSLVWDENVWKEVIKELYRITKVGGVVVWIVGDATINGSETGTSFKQALYFKECGFNIHDTMIWDKGCFSAVGALQNKYAPVFEYMFIFSKGKIKSFTPIKDKINKHFGVKIHGTIRNENGETVPMRGLKITKEINKYGQRFNIWHKAPQRQKGGHPAPFPIQLASDHIISWSNEGNIILDCFMGSGTTAIAAINTNRNYIGFEKEAKYFEIANNRVSEHIKQTKLFN